MKNKFFSLDYLNKLQVVTPSFLLIGCDYSRGDEFVITGVVTLVLAFLLSALEPYYRSATTMRAAVKWALFCVATAVLASLSELMLFWKISKLHGPIGYYGIPSIIVGIAGIFCIFALLACWADRKRHA
jgi:hypothetical protein